MRRVFYAVAALSLFIASCDKDDEVMDKVDVPDRGAIRFINNSQNDQYDFYVENTKMGNIYGNDTVVVPNIIIGKRLVKAIQISNLSGAPTLRQETVVVQKDSVSTFIFP